VNRILLVVVGMNNSVNLKVCSQFDVCVTAGSGLSIDVIF
jgi:hypothetical protein